MEWSPGITPEEKKLALGSIDTRATEADMDLMKLGLESERRMINRSIQRDLKYRWPNSKVPYRIEAAVNTAKRLVIASVNLVVIHVKTFSWLTIFF